MTTNFPTSLDSFTNPSATDAMDSATVPHATQHANLNDAMEAVQAKLGVGSGTIGEWTSFTPSWNNFTPGNGTEDWYYAVVNEVLVVEGRTQLGSTSSVGTNPEFYLPNSYTMNNLGVPLGIANYQDFGSAAYQGGIIPSGPDTIRFMKYDVSGSEIIRANVTSAAPFTWTTSDSIRCSFTVRLT